MIKVKKGKLTHNTVLEGWNGERYGLKTIAKRIITIPMAFPVFKASGEHPRYSDYTVKNAKKRPSKRN